jgi:DHA2 family multidrug resistance protein-like MFS transporter
MAAFSTTPEMLIASRALLGIAGATLAPSTLSLIFNMFRDQRQRAVAVAVWISAFSAGSAHRPVHGGNKLEHLLWGSVFLLPLPVIAHQHVQGPIVLPQLRDPDAAQDRDPECATEFGAGLRDPRGRAGAFRRR